MPTLFAVAEDRMLWTTVHKLAWVCHVFGVIIWLAGLMYMTRLLFRRGGSSEESERAILDLARRLHNGAVIPGLVLALFGGIWLVAAYRQEYLQQGWFHAKLFIALLFVLIQAYSIVKTYDLLRSPAERRPTVFAVMHFGSGALLFLVLLLVRFRPF